MKLLFDQNLSSALVARLDDLFPGSTHVKAEGMSEAPDLEVWLFAKQQGFTIVSKDSDFQQRSLLFGAPPKVVWLRVGNCPTSRIAMLLGSIPSPCTPSNSISDKVSLSLRQAPDFEVRSGGTKNSEIRRG